MDIEENKAVVCECDKLGNAGGDLARLDVLCDDNMVNHS
jgi:hypothetical protein